MRVEHERAGERSALRETFERDGFVLIEGALGTDEIERLTAAVDRVYRAERGGEGGPLHLLAFCGRDAAFLEMIDHPATLPHVVDALGPGIFMYHCHLDVHPPEPPDLARPWMWHQDGGIVNRDLETCPRPRLSVKVAYFLTDLSEPGRGNFAVVPGSHGANAIERPRDDGGEVCGSVPVLARAGDAVLFDRRLWHMRSHNGSPITRKALFYAYTFRWVRPRDELDVPTDLLHLITPVRSQLLGAGSSAIEFWMPDEGDLPVRTAFGG